MLLKRADDKSKRVTLLEELHRSSALGARQKQWLREELGRLRKGIQGEADSAYYLDHLFKDSENHVVLHDLRFVVDGDTAQIDHLLISRGLGFFLLETKNYSGNVSINAHGEFTVDYDGDRFGVPSPIEQSHRHQRVLMRLFDRLGIDTRVGDLKFHHVVMFHPKAIIERPKASEFDTRNVIKADQFPSWREKYVDREISGAGILSAIVNLRSFDTIKDWGEKLVRQHRPADLLNLPEFMRPKVAAKPASSPVPAASAAPSPMRTPDVKPIEQAASASEKRLICLHCQSKISYPEGKFCWNNSARFQGGQYCREHQSLFPPHKA